MKKTNDGKIMAFKMTADLEELIIEYCKKNDLNQSQVIRNALRQFFNTEVK